MNKLSPEKKKKIMIVGGVTLGILVVLYMFVVNSQMEKTSDIETKIAEVEGKKQDMDKKIMTAKVKQTEFEELRAFLGEKEKGMASLRKDEWKLWLRGQLQLVATNRANFHQVKLGEITLDPGETTAELLPKFPYMVVRFKVPLEGHYQDIGKYIAALENNYPFMRVENINMYPVVVLGGAASPDAEGGPKPDGAAAATHSKPELLSVMMHIVTLLRNP